MRWLSPLRTDNTVRYGDRKSCIDDDVFAELIEPHRRELHAHCYRMLGSVHDADDALQEAFVRAWRGLPDFEGRGSVRGWLYRITTNVCLRAAERRVPEPTDEEPVLIEPYPGPAERSVDAETLELAFVAALQHLPPAQRAALILREALDFSARETAEMLDMTEAAVNSALQRARKSVDERVPERSQQAALRELGDERTEQLVAAFVDAMGAGDVDAVVALLTDDAEWTMPPMPLRFRGRSEAAHFLRTMPFAAGRRWRHVRITANGQLAAAAYTREDGDDEYRLYAIDVMTVRGGRVAAIASFLDPAAVGGMGLPAVLGAG